MITVLLVDDHTYIRKGIRYLIESTNDLEVVAIASNGIEAVAKARLHQPHVVILDISMPFMDGIEATRQITSSCPGTRVLTLSIYDHPAYVEGALEAGAYGYILKESIGNELLDAIRALHSGGHYFSRRVSGNIHSFPEDHSDTWVE